MVKNKFWGKSMEIFPYGNVHVFLKNPEEDYVWNKVTTSINNIISGKRSFDHYGEMIIRCRTSGVVCKINFKKASYFSKVKNEINGIVTSASGKPVYKLSGKWNTSIVMEDAENNPPKHKHVIWKISPAPENSEKYYGFTSFAMQLNEILPEDRKTAAHTDTRFRPDQRCLEEGDIKKAESEKLRVEHIQREARKKA